LRDIIILAICGVLCGAEGWVEIEEFGKAKEAWFTELQDQATSKKALHPFLAWAVENRRVLAQLATEEKSNEITAIPLLLKQLARKRVYCDD
jgi:hypothetical protein